MPGNAPVSLEPVSIQLTSSEYQQGLCSWIWPETDSYVGEMLRTDIPHRVNYGECRIWIYLDSNRETVGFGTLDLCNDYCNKLGDERPYPYIPLLAVNPAVQGRGYGSFILGHLIDEAVVTVAEWSGHCQSLLFLDVYENNHKAISMYERRGFRKINDHPELDDRPHPSYFIMARNLTIAR